MNMHTQTDGNLRVFEQSITRLFIFLALDEFQFEALPHFVHDDAALCFHGRGRLQSGSNHW